MHRLRSDGHCFLKGTIQAGSVVATGELTAPNISINGDSLIIDTSGLVSIVAAPSNTLQLDGEGVLVQGSPGPVTIVSNGAGNDVTLNSADRVILDGATIQIGLSTGASIGFYGDAGITKPTITGSRDSNVALGELLGFLHNMGLIVNNTTTRCRSGPAPSTDPLDVH